MIRKWRSRRVRGGREEDMLCNGEEETWDFRFFADFGLKQRRKERKETEWIMLLCCRGERGPGKI